MTSYLIIAIGVIALTRLLEFIANRSTIKETFQKSKGDPKVKNIIELGNIVESFSYLILNITILILCTQALVTFHVANSLPVFLLLVFLSIVVSRYISVRISNYFIHKKATKLIAEMSQQAKYAAFGADSSNIYQNQNGGDNIGQ